MSDFITASSYCESVFDGTHDTPKPVNSGYPLVTSKHIVGRTLDISTAYYISLEDYNAIQKRSKVSQWDVLFSMIGSVGEVYLEKNEVIPYAIKNIGVFSCKNEEKARWLYYYLQSPFATTHIKRYLNGAVQKFLSLGALREFPVLKFNKQSSLITKVLSDLDAKIELNNKINQELEAMAKTLYDYWFVQFDFPNADGKPYKSSGGKMVYNAELKREIPEGWEVKKLGDIIKKYADKSTHIESKNILNEGSYPVITQDNGDLISGFTNENNPIEDVPLIVFGDHSCTLRYIDFPFFRGADGTQIMYFEEDLTIYVYLFLQMIITQIPGYGKYERHYKYLKEFNIIIPKAKFLSEFQKIVEPIFNKISKSRLQNQHLTTLRDWLLPMLMNGQVASRASATGESRASATEE